MLAVALQVPTALLASVGRARVRNPQTTTVRDRLLTTNPLGR
jgi:hypothetical protein